MFLLCVFVCLKLDVTVSYIGYVVFITEVSFILLVASDHTLGCFPFYLLQIVPEPASGVQFVGWGCCGFISEDQRNVINYFFFCVFLGARIFRSGK